MPPNQQLDANIDQHEINHFSTLSEKWWDDQGEMKSLHLLNPIRLRFMLDHIGTIFPQNSDIPSPLKGLDILDVGCGGGLTSEPLARLGGRVTGLDACLESINVAQAHAMAQNLEINYIHTTLQNHLLEKSHAYDVVVALEILEHVPNPRAFIQACTKALKPGGLLFLSTLNRTLKAYLLGVVFAENVLGWVPKGTHDWQKFIRPSEIRRWLDKEDYKIKDCKGLTYTPFKGEWTLSADTDINYIMAAQSNS